MISLESFDAVDDLVAFDPATGEVESYSKQQNPDMAPRSVQGITSKLDGHQVFLYREGEILHFRVDDADFELNDNTRIELVQGDLNILTLIRSDVPLFRLAYRPYVIDEVDRWRMYLNPLIKENHLDFGLFVYDVTKDVQNRTRVYRQL